ncbi:MAG: hypothetical protein DRQ46_07755 [Gammaproteobacteria bacterium]|nr:MAG: hypothetical protein DRQ46_07755 [Gammaproteobacteria bacterium]
MAVIDSLVAELGFDFDDKALAKFNKGFEQAGKILVGIVGAATAASAAIGVFTKEIAASNDETGKFAQRTGVALETLQELGFVAELNGGSIDSMNNSLANLSRTAAESAKGMGSNVETFGMLGVSVTDAQGQVKDAATLFGDVSDAIASLGTQAERLEFAQKLGLGEDLLLAIQQGSAAIAEQRKEARELGFVIDQDAATAAADFNDNLLRMTSIIKGVSSAIGTRLMKQAKPMYDLFIKWFKANKEIIQQNIGYFLDKVAKASSAVFNVLFRVYKVVDNLIQGFGGWKNAIMIVVGAMAILNASTLLIPALILAAGAAILLLIEDVQKFAEGGDSALGSLIEKFPALKQPLIDLIDLIKIIGHGWSLIFSQGEEAFDGFILAIQDIGKAIQSFFIGPLNEAIGLLNVLPGVDIGKLAAPDAQSGDLGGLFSGLASSVFAGADLLPTASQTQNTSNRTTNSKTKVNNTFNINGGNPAEVEATVKRVINDEYRNADDDLSSPVDM